MPTSLSKRGCLQVVTILFALALVVAVGWAVKTTPRSTGTPADQAASAGKSAPQRALPGDASASMPPGGPVSLGSGAQGKVIVGRSIKNDTSPPLSEMAPAAPAVRKEKETERIY